MIRTPSLSPPPQVANPPSRVDGTPQFAKTKKRESYFQEFCNVTEAFQENRVKAHRLSNEAAELAMQVCMYFCSFRFEQRRKDNMRRGFDKHSQGFLCSH